MRVYELSKEINVPNKELVEYLSKSNSDIKTHSSSVSDAEAESARKYFAKGRNTSETKEQAPKTETPKTETPKTETPKTETAAGADASKDAAPKKKIFASYNPQNSGRKEVRDQRRTGDRRDGRPGDRRDNKVRPDGRPVERIRPRDNAKPGERPSDRVRPDGTMVDRKPRPDARPAERRQDGRPDDNRRQDGRPDDNRRQDGRPGDNRRQDGRPGDNRRQDGRPGDNRRQDGRPGDNRRQDGRPGDNRRQDGRPGDNRRQDGRPGDNRRQDGRSGDNRRQDGRFADRRQDGRNQDRNAAPDNRRTGGNDRNNFRKDDRNSGFDGGEAIKEREAKEQRNRDRENRKRDNSSYDKTERMENTKALEKNMNKVKQQQKKAEEETIRTLTLPDTLTVKELADMMKIAPAALVKKLFLQGTVVTINQEIDFDTAEEIALEYNCICEHEVKVDVIEELLKEEEDDPSTLVPRPPVVCVMGHVDHGKTSLLDAIRSTHVTSREAGGITQHIGAYTVEAHGQQITFLDTPGHEAFTAMRMRGAKSTDIAILVVAADDGVMPQTVEAINHAKAAGIEIVVAINKIDKPSANIERVKQELVEYELIPEDWGGSTIFCPVSAHTGEGIDNLLDMLLLTAEILELKANPNRRARGLVLEGRLDKGKGPVATMLVQKGTLHVGDHIAVGSCHGKIRAMVDDKGKRIQQAGPSIPVEILGLNDVPNAGDVFVSPETEKEARSFAETYIREGREKLLEETKSKMSLDDLFSQIQAGNLKELHIIVKADVQGSVEAVKQSLMKLSNDEVVVKVIHAGVGAINESDVILASASNAIIIGFNVRPDNQAKAVADAENVDLRLYRVIYQAIEDVEAAMKGMLDPKYEEKVIGHAEVRQTYKASDVGTIAGSYVLDGVLTRGCSVRLMRGDDMIYDGPLASLKRFKDDAKEVKEGYECGCVLEKFNDIMEGDILEAYTMVEIPR
ncbi:MAG TPA: translation initiation factor IF-2 [Lachnospiraceae bacterium]|nr:translation initiation factor IF-2 [Lachnospiraceae bacterium]